MFDARKVKDEVVAWIREYFNENGQGCPAVVGISGGKDSSVVAALCAEAIGKERVFGVLMPRGEQYDIDTALELAAFLGIKHCVINIGESVETLLASISAAGLALNRQAEVNTPARVRMSTLYAVSAIINGRTANTCNLSEDWVGYSTKFGDSAGDFSPMAKLTVTEVKAIGRELGLPAKFVDKVPEDGLTGLSDEENLGFTYAVLDKYIREGACEGPAIKEKIDTLHKQGRHKLELMPCFEYQP